MKDNTRREIFDAAKLENEYMYSFDFISLFLTSLFCIIVLIWAFIFNPMVSFISGLFVLIARLLPFLLIVISIVFLFIRRKKYGIVLSMLPLLINILSLLSLQLFSLGRAYISDPYVITYEREYSPDSSHVSFAWTFNDGVLGSPIYSCAMATADTANNINNYTLSRALYPVGWNSDNSYNVRINWNHLPESEVREFRIGQEFEMNGIKFHIIN
jgi:hypothetical protein